MVENSVKMDYREHERTYAGFIRFGTWAAIAVGATLVLMAWFLL